MSLQILYNGYVATDSIVKSDYEFEQVWAKSYHCNVSVIRLIETVIVVSCSIPGGGRDFSLRHHVQIGSGVHPVSYPRWVKRPGRETDYSPPRMFVSRGA
jgi:hypothetical protein